MLAFILGTSDGKALLKELNKYTDDFLLSTATKYGGDILKDFKYKYLNTSPLNEIKLEELLKEKEVQALVDFSHPYAVEVSKNAMEACEKLGIEYIRFERKGVAEKYKDNPKVHLIKNLEYLNELLENKKGNILNTMGSNNIGKLECLNLSNRIIHRVLPTKEVIEKCNDFEVELKNIIAIKGPISYDLNLAFLKNYDIEAMILKDSGESGATEEKIQSALDLDIDCYVLEKKTLDYKKVFYNEKEILDYLLKSYLKS